MGVNVRIFIKKHQLKNLFDFDYDYFYFLMLKLRGKRWYRFEDMFGLENVDIVTSKELLKHIAINTNLRLKSRKWWVEISSEYDLIFVRDDISREELKKRIKNFDDYVDLNNLEFEIIEKVRKEILSQYLEFKTID